jgi:hypothetical protein
MRYVLEGLFRGMELEVPLDDDGCPPCLFCERPVRSRSTGGPLICGPCDMGYDYNPHIRWTTDRAREMHENHRRNLLKYEVRRWGHWPGQPFVPFVRK